MAALRMWLMVTLMFLAPLSGCLSFLEDGDEDGPVEPTVTNAASLHYRAVDEMLEYQGEVEMHSKEMTLRGDRVEVRLSKGGIGVEEVYAEGEVAISLAGGKAAGAHARYLPNEQQMTLQGEQAWLQNDGKLTEGKQLTFFLSNDKISVDSQEQNRTKTSSLQCKRWDRSLGW